MPESLSARVVCAVAAVGLLFGAVGCSSGGDKADAKPKPAKSSEAPKEVDYEELALAALGAEDLKVLADHEPDEEPVGQPADGLPFDECDYDKPDPYDPQASAYQWFKGEPGVDLTSYVVEDDAAKAFAELRKQWKSDTCQSYEDDVDDVTASYDYSHEITKPKGIEREAWFGACFTGVDESKTRQTSDCRVIFLIDDNSFVELESYQQTKDISANAKFLARIAEERLAVG